MATLKGRAVVFGADGLVWTGGIASATTLAHHSSITVDRDSQVVDLPNDVGDIDGRVFYAGRKQLSVTVVPYHATTLAGAQTSLDAWSLLTGSAPGGAGVTCTIADSRGTIADDVYNVVSANMSRTQTGAATVDLVLEAFEDNDTTDLVV